MNENNKSFIDLTIKGLKQRLDKDFSLTIQKDKGLVSKVSCHFNQPALQVNITRFEKETNLKIPIDFQKFLLLHDGAKIFEGEYGGGMHLYSLDEIKSNHLPHMPDHRYPIGYYGGEYLFIDSIKCENNDMNYLFWDDSSSPVDKWYNLNLSFELFLDRFIIAQGSYFWLWEKNNTDKSK